MRLILVLIVSLVNAQPLLVRVLSELSKRNSPKSSDSQDSKLRQDLQMDVNETSRADESIRKARSTGLTALPCRTNFQPACPMNPYVRYWRRAFHHEDCYASPLRAVNARVAREYRKYLVFMPE
jgi:hypothetical protein